MATHTAGFPRPSRHSKLQVKPGTSYIYGDYGTNWLANAITNRFRQDQRFLASTRLFHRMWLTGDDIAWRTRPVLYGPGVWPASDGVQRRRAGLTGIPRNAYGSWGLNNNHKSVLPSQGVVVVRLGTDGWSNYGYDHAKFLKPIVDAVLS